MAKEKEIYDFNNYNDDDFVESPENESKEDYPPNKAVIVAIELPNQRRWRTLESLDELKSLAETLGLEVDKHFINKREFESSSFFIGKGTIESLKDYCKTNRISYIIFDDDLSPAQIKNISRELDKTEIMDRSVLILEIFAKRAKTREGKLQVELAQLEYMLPRLTKFWRHLSRQEGVSGGIVGVRGPGEKQLEMDRRQIRARINSIKRELKVVESYRATQRKKRQRNHIPVIAVIGYTNAGKSTLFNQISSADTLVEDKLFATLDPATRKFKLPNNQDAIIIDTVGFIRKLPHQLIESFKATLEEVRQADVLIHVLDVSDDKHEERKKTVFEVLKELESDNKIIITALNKIDLLDNLSALNSIKSENLPCVAVSAKTGEGVKGLFSEIVQFTSNSRVRANLFIPIDHLNLISKVYEHGKVFYRKDADNGTYLEAEYDNILSGIIGPYHIQADNKKNQSF